VSIIVYKPFQPKTFSQKSENQFAETNEIEIIKKTNKNKIRPLFIDSLKITSLNNLLHIHIKS